MTFDYSGIISTASNLLDKFGKTTAIIRVKGAATSDPVTGTISYAASTDTPINAVEVEHNEFYTPGAVIEDGDIFWVLDGRANPEDDLIVGGVLGTMAYNIVQTWPVAPSGVFIAMRVQTRGGVIDASAGTPGTAPGDAFDYSGIAGTASDLIEEFGQSGSLLTVTSQTSDPVTGTVEADTIGDTDVQAVQVKHNEKYTPGALIEDGDRFWYLDAIALMGDELLTDDSSYKVVKVWPVKPGDTSIVSRIQTRGGIRITLRNVISGTDNVISGTDNVVSAA